MTTICSWTSTMLQSGDKQYDDDDNHDHDDNKDAIGDHDYDHDHNDHNDRSHDSKDIDFHTGGQFPI